MKKKNRAANGLEALDFEESDFDFQWKIVSKLGKKVDFANFELKEFEGKRVKKWPKNGFF